MEGLIAVWTLQWPCCIRKIIIQGLITFVEGLVQGLSTFVEGLVAVLDVAVAVLHPKEHERLQAPMEQSLLVSFQVRVSFRTKSSSQLY